MHNDFPIGHNGSPTQEPCGGGGLKVCAHDRSPIKQRWLTPFRGQPHQPWHVRLFVKQPLADRGFSMDSHSTRIIPCKCMNSSAHVVAGTRTDVWADGDGPNRSPFGNAWLSPAVSHSQPPRATHFLSHFLKGRRSCHPRTKCCLCMGKVLQGRCTLTPSPYPVAWAPEWAAP